VGNDHDTAAFAANAIRRWWLTMGKERYASSRRLMITADAGGSNGYRLRLWKVELQKLASEVRNHQLSWWYDGEPLKAV
jgi:hypothetical protein